MDDDEFVPGLHDPISVPEDQRVARYEAHLREWVDFELAVHMAAISAIAMKDIEDRMAEMKIQIEPFRNIKNTIEVAYVAAQAGLQIGRISAEKLMVFQKEKIDKTNSLSSAGAKGAQSRHRPVAELKAWAVSEANKIHSSHKDAARKLTARIPKHLANASKDPQRLIYDTLRAAAKQN